MKNATCDFILLLEDDSGYADEIRKVFTTYHEYSLLTVSTIKEYHASLKEKVPSLVIADLDLSGGHCWEILSYPADVLTYPVIVLTRYNDLEIAVKAMRSGAFDCHYKTPEIMMHLPRIVARALREWENITKRKMAEGAYHQLLNNSLQGFVIYQDGHIVFANGAIGKIMGYSPEELKEMSFVELTEVLYHEDRPKVIEFLTKLIQESELEIEVEYRALRKSGEIKRLISFAGNIIYLGKPALQATFIDVTEHQELKEILK